MHAEQAYLFRHALLRDAAYQLQLPGEKAQLHRLAFELIEQLYGGPAPERPALGSVEEPAPSPHATDAVAHELAGHARSALQIDGFDQGKMIVALKLYLQRAAEHAENHFQFAEAQRHWVALSELVQDCVKGEVLRRAGRAASHVGKSGEAKGLFEQALTIHRRVGDRRFEGLALGNVAGVSNDVGNVEQAERDYDEARHLLRQAGDRNGEGAALAGLASVYLNTARAEDAERAYEQALTMFRESGSRVREGSVLANMAILYWQTARYDLAEQAYERALDIHRAVKNRRGEGVAIGNLAALYQSTGRSERAEAACAQALAISREVGDRRAEGVALGGLASLRQEAGRVEQALQDFELALAIHREVGNRRFEGGLLCNYSVCLLAMRRPQDARSSWRRGAQMIEELGDKFELERRTASMRKTCAKAGVPPFDEGAATDSVAIGGQPPS